MILSSSEFFFQINPNNNLQSQNQSQSKNNILINPSLLQSPFKPNSEIGNRISTANTNQFRSTGLSNIFSNNNNTNLFPISRLNSPPENLNFNKTNFDNLIKNNNNNNFNKFKNFNFLNKNEKEKSLDISSLKKLQKENEVYKSMTEKLVFNNNVKELYEKRNLEENKEFINEYALNKAKYREEIEKKYELKTLLNFYENKMKVIKEEKVLRKSKSKIEHKKNDDKKKIEFLKGKEFEFKFVVTTVNSFSLLGNSIANNDNVYKTNIILDVKEVIRKRYENLKDLKRLNFDNVKNNKTKEEENKEKEKSKNF